MKVQHQDELTLPVLQIMLDRLPVARTLSLARTQIERLFGHNDVGIPRLRRFAHSHSCVIAYADGTVTFHKVPHRPGSIPIEISTLSE